MVLIAEFVRSVRFLHALDVDCDPVWPSHPCCRMWRKMRGRIRCGVLKSTRCRRRKQLRRRPQARNGPWRAHDGWTTALALEALVALFPSLPYCDVTDTHSPFLHKHTYSFANGDARMRGHTRPQSIVFTGMSGGAPPLSTWLPLDLLAFELDTALAIQRWRMSRSYQHTVNKLLSPHPLHDASVVTLIVLLFTVPFAGYTLLWCALASFGSCFIWDKLVHAHTPRALDPRIIALSNVSPGGFPCFEIVLAASVFISIGWVSTVCMRGGCTHCSRFPPTAPTGATFLSCRPFLLSCCDSDLTLLLSS